MSWAVGVHDGRDIGYGVPAICDQPDCGAAIDRGLGYVCGGDVYGGEDGCGRFCCSDHLFMKRVGPALVQVCDRCWDGKPPFEPTPDVAEWIVHKLTDESWAAWRAEHPEWIAEQKALALADVCDCSDCVERRARGGR